MVALRHIVYRRAIRIYVVAIVAPALVLLYLGLKSVQRQRDAINALLVSNLRLSGEKLASELEHRTAQLAGSGAGRDAAEAGPLRSKNGFLRASPGQPPLCVQCL
jgi:uncharacterized small protein (DUF1192 family)